MKRWVDDVMFRDKWFESLSAAEKYMFIYLLINPSCNIIGFYEISTTLISFETGLPEEICQNVIAKLSKSGKIVYVQGYMFVFNYFKHRFESKNDRLIVQFCWDKIPESVKKEKTITSILNDKGIGYYLELIKESNKEKREGKASVVCKAVIEDLNRRLKRKGHEKFRSTTRKTQSLISSRLKEGFEQSDFLAVNEKMIKAWTGTKYEEYLRPQTLYSEKFENYLHWKGQNADDW